MGNDTSRVLLRVKAVPGASSDTIAGMLGERVKIRISAAPEGGRANKAIAALLAGPLGLKPAQVRLVSGRANPEKVFEIPPMTRHQLNDALGFDATNAIV